ncbi:MAG: PAS domain S-box protein [Desulfomonilaceae bacterium]
MMTETTENQGTAETLRDSEGKLRAVIYGSPIPQFMINREHRVIYWNQALETISGIPSDEVIGTREHWKAFYNEPRPTMADLLVDGESYLVPDWYAGKYRKSKLIADAYEATDFFPTLGNDGKWLSFTVAAIRDSEGNIIGSVETLQDITEQKRAEEELFKSKEELEARVSERTSELLEACEELESELEERRTIENTLRQSEIKFRTIVNFTYDWEYWVDAEGNFLYVSPSCERITGYSAQEFLDDPDLMNRIIHPDDRATMLDHYHNVRKVAPYEVDSIDFRIIRRDGETRWIGHVCQPVYGQDGQPSRRRGSNRDITERKLAEESLKEATVFLNTLMNAIPVPLFYKDSNGRYIGFNKSFEEFFGKTSQELVGKNVFDIHPRDMAELYHAKDLELFHDPGAQIYEAQIKEAHGAVQDVLIHKSTFSDLQGHILGLIGVFLDITEQKLAKEALAESEKRFRKVFEQGPIGIAMLGLDYRWIAINATFSKIVGYAEDELTKLTFVDITHPDDIDEDVGYAEKLKRGEIPSCRLKKRYIKRNGEVVWVNLTATLIRDDHDKELYYLNMIEDITESKQLEEELRQSELRLSRAELVAGFGNWEVDLSTRRLATSNGARKIYGLGQQVEWAFDDIQKFPLPEYRSPLDEAFLALIKDGAPYDIEFKIKRANDDQVIDIHSIAHYDAEKNLVFGTIHDITNLKRAEESHRLLFAAIEQAADAIIITGATGIIQYVNPALEILSGYSRNELLGQTPNVFKSDFHDEDFYKQLWETINAGKIWSGRFINSRKDGTEYHEDISISPVYNKTRKLTNFVAVKHDVTKQLELQEQLLQAQKMEAIGTLAGGLAHDFNNKLQVIAGYVELILFNKDLPETVKSELGVIKKTINGSAELVKEMMLFSRKTPAEHQPIELNKLVAQSRSILIRSIPKMIEIDLSLADDLWTINAAPNQIDQILMNLAVNAKDAMPDGGKLTIKTNNIVLDEEYCRFHPNTKPGRYVLLTVSDTGTGMNKETVGHIFEPFFTTKEPGKGTGLGLSVVYGIVEQHGGKIICDSEPSVGTTFSIYFPAIEEVPQEQYSEKKEPPKGQGETILLVDDESNFLEATSRLLNRANYRVITASNGKEALEHYEKRPKEIRLVVLDLIMPRMGGAECLRSLLTMDPKLRVLMVSGALKAGMAKDLKEAGAKGFIKKPFDMSRMLEKIRKIIDEE